MTSCCHYCRHSAAARCFSPQWRPSSPADASALWHRILWSSCSKRYIKTYFKQENTLMQLQKESSRSPVWVIFYETLPVLPAGEASVTSWSLESHTALAHCWFVFWYNICNCNWLVQENTRSRHNMATAAVLQLQSTWAALQSRPRGRTAYVVIITWTLLHI